MITGTLLFGLIIGLITNLLGFLIKSFISWFSEVYNHIFYNAMAVETNFYDIGINFGGLYRTIYTFAIALLMMFFIKKLVETYMAWSNRRSRNISYDDFSWIFKSYDYND